MGQKSLEVTAMGMEKPADKKCKRSNQSLFLFKSFICDLQLIRGKKKKKTSTLSPKQVCP